MPNGKGWRPHPGVESYVSCRYVVQQSRRLGLIPGNMTSKIALVTTHHQQPDKLSGGQDSEPALSMAEGSNPAM